MQGKFLFSGDREASPAYELDLTAASGVAELDAATATASRQVEDPAGGSFACCLTARSIFDARNADGTTAAGNVFAALNDMRLALTAGDSDAIQASLSSVQEASLHLGRSQSFYATVANRIDQAESYSAALGVRLTTSISEIEDSDTAAEALELTQANTQLKAAFEMRSSLPTTSLFDYLG